MKSWRDAPIGKQHMQYSTRDILFAVTILAILLGSILHAISLRRETDAFKESARHELMSLEFETKYADFTSSFEDSPFECITSNLKYMRLGSSGTYSFDCVVKRRDGKPMQGRRFRDLLQPILNESEYRIDIYKDWSVYTDWELDSAIDTMEQSSWDVKLRIEYRFHEDFPLIEDFSVPNPT